jgi:hypothetical protein
MQWAEERTGLLSSEEPTRVLGLQQFVEEETVIAMKNAAKKYLKAADMLEEAGLEGLYRKAQQDAETVGAAAATYEEILRGRAESEKTVMELFAEFSGAFKANQMRATKDEKEDFDLIKESV